MIVTKKMLLVLTLVGVLFGAGIGSLITHSAASTGAANTSYDAAQTAGPSEKTRDQIATEKSSQFGTTQEQTAYRQGFDEGYSSCTSAASSQTRTGGDSAAYKASTNSAPNSAPVRRYDHSRRVSYDNRTQPRSRTFWQKHRDKLTMAMGTGLGVAIGGLAGGGKGAGIGALAGAGGSALYTYKLRQRSR